MKESDCVVLWTLELVLVAVAIYAVGKDIYILVSERARGISAVAIRGDATMNALYVVYGATTVVYTFIVQETNVFRGHKVLVTVFNYAWLTYLFFFSLWFRNEWFMPLLIRAIQR